MRKWLAAAAVLMTLLNLSAGWEDGMKRGKDSRGREYLYAEKDPFQVRIHHLKNGLTLVLSRNPMQPSVSVMTAVRAGSTDEPVTSTGLAHYFEHMMFKGTSRIGSLDYTKEKPLLDRIEELFEERRNTPDLKKKQALYREIDSLSGKAAAYASAGEFSKLASSLGADGLNAATGRDYTGYVATVPASELKKYLLLDAERFREPVLRLFHTELEAVYEEFNRYQDNDSSRAYNTLLALLHPTHPAGRSIIGFPQHLKYPSMKDIRAFFKRYYVPSNMMLVLAGDIDYEHAADLAEESFGKLPAAPAPERKLKADPPLTKDVCTALYGREGEFLLMGASFPNTPENSLKSQLLASILTDAGYGILEQDLVQTQKLLSVSAGLYGGREDFTLYVTARPRAGQTLDEVEKLIREELDKLRKGRIEPWRIKAVADNQRVLYARLRDSDPLDLAWELTALFTFGDSYASFVSMPDRMEKLPIAEMEAFLRKELAHFAVVKKFSGKSDAIVKVEKPAITPVPLNGEKLSAFGQEFLAIPPEKRAKPDFPDWERDLSGKKLSSGASFTYVRKVSSSGLFTLRIQQKVGKNSNRLLQAAPGFFQLLGAGEMNAPEFRQALYRSALKYEVFSNRFRTGVEISGPGENLAEGLKLLEKLIRSPRWDGSAAKLYTEGIQKKRNDDKLNPRSIFRQGISHALWSGKNPDTAAVLSNRELKKLTPEQMTGTIRELLTSPGVQFCYAGPEPMEKAEKLLSGWKLDGKTTPERVKRPLPPDVRSPKIYLLNSDTVQMLVGFASPAGKFDPADSVPALIYNEYFGWGLNSVLFSEIRESRALAYTAGGAFQTADEAGRKDLTYVMAGTQPDKLFLLLDAALELLKKMPEREKLFHASRNAVQKLFETDRYYGMDLLERKEAFDRMKVTPEWSRDNYRRLQKAELRELTEFASRRIGNRKFHIFISGNLKGVDRKKLEKYGEIIVVDKKTLFGY